MSSPTNNWRSGRTERRFKQEIVADMTTWNAERKDTWYDKILDITVRKHIQKSQ